MHVVFSMHSQRQQRRDHCQHNRQGHHHPPWHECANNHTMIEEMGTSVSTESQKIIYSQTFRTYATHFCVTGAEKISSLCPANVKAVLPGMQQVEVPMTFKSGQILSKILSRPFFWLIRTKKKKLHRLHSLIFVTNTPTKKTQNKKQKTHQRFLQAIFKNTVSSDVHCPFVIFHATSRRATCFSGRIAWHCLDQKQMHSCSRNGNFFAFAPFMRKEFRRCLERRMGAMKVPWGGKNSPVKRSVNRRVMSKFLEVSPPRYHDS